VIRRFILIFLTILSFQLSQARDLAEEIDSVSQKKDSTQKTQNTPAIAKLVAGAFTAVALPILFATVVADVFPISGIVAVEGESAYFGLCLETGVGFGDRRGFGRYPDYRIQLQYSYFPLRPNTNLLRLICSYDVPMFPIDRRKLYTFGLSPGLGIFSDFHSKGIFPEVSVWLMHPSLFFIGFIPQHNIYLRFRFCYPFDPSPSFAEIGLGVSSTFTFPK
jgi:hypothetical protein